MKPSKRDRVFLAGLAAVLLAVVGPSGQAAEPAGLTWTADNGDGTFTNPLFYDEFSDPDMIRVGDDYYLTGTTMHTMPGLPILHSRDLVNWRFVGYVADRLDLGPNFRLEGGDVYGQGFWAPSFRYHDGVFHVFSNVNREATYHFTARDPAGPWTATRMKRGFHDLSVLFDDDGKVYVVWGYRGIRMAQLNADLTDIVPGTEREIIAPEQGMGEGLHFSKVGGKYWITSAWFDGMMRLPVARADRPDGPYEVNREISVGEDFGLAEGNRLEAPKPPFTIIPPDPRPRGRTALHQGGYVQTPGGAWWGYSMMDYNSVGRLTALSPVTWKDGWPYFGLPGNLGRNPRTWVKPDTGATETPHAPYERSDDFAGAGLKPIWQWNHAPVDGRWSLAERPGFLRLKTLPAADFWTARNTLTQRSIGPESRPRVALDASGLAEGDVAGLALLNLPYAWIGVRKVAGGLEVEQRDQRTGRSAKTRVAGTRVWLQADADFMAETARFSYSGDGNTFASLGEPMTMVFQLRTFQGVRYGLFAYNEAGREGGHADFDTIEVGEPHPRGLRRPIPDGRKVALTALGQERTVTVEKRPLGRALLRGAGGYLTVAADGTVSASKTRDDKAQAFQWIETPTGELALMSLVTSRFLRVSPAGVWTADSPGPQSDGLDGARFVWAEVR
jgi:xylan 1,4-beta-xylosidase